MNLDWGIFWMLKITCLKNGPILIVGDSLSIIVNEDGTEEGLKEGPIALCRCGFSNKKPFCDGSHKNCFVAEQVEISEK